MQAKSDIDQTYRILIVIWVSLAVSQILFLLLIFFTKPEVLTFDFSRPLLGDNTVLIAGIALVSLLSLAWSVIRPARYIQRAIDEQEPEHVQAAMIIGTAQAMSVSFWGVFLAFAFDYQYFFIWMIVGFIATCLHFPRRRDLENASIKSL